MSIVGLIFLAPSSSASAQQATVTIHLPHRLRSPLPKRDYILFIQLASAFRLIRAGILPTLTAQCTRKPPGLPAGLARNAPPQFAASNPLEHSVLKLAKGG
jgi:hypothetical protein